MDNVIIFGATGQDGSYLSEILLSEGYRVFGVKRRSSSINTSRISHLFENENFVIRHGDITDTSSVMQLVLKIQPKFIFNLAAQSHVGVSFNEPEFTAQVDAVGTLRVLEAIRLLSPTTVFYQASTSELYGGLDTGILNEKSLFNPRSPYAAAKLYSYYMTQQYREGYNLSAYNGILFNHESPRRGENFVTRKISLGISDILKGKSNSIILGNLDALRDWGHARDYCYAMYKMVTCSIPDNYVVATGECHSVREFLQLAFNYVGIELGFRGSDASEVGFVKSKFETKFQNSKIKIGQEIIKVDPMYYRPLEVPRLQGDASKFNSATGWKPKTSFKELVQEMVEYDAST